MHAKSHLLHTAQQWEQPGTTSIQICNPKVIHTQWQGNQFSILEMSSQIATTEKWLKPLQARVPLSSCALVLLHSKLEQGYNPHLEVLAFLFLYLVEPPTFLRWPWQHSDILGTSTAKREGLGPGWKLCGQARTFPILPAGALGTGMELFGGFSSSLYPIPRCHWQNILTKQIIQPWQLLLWFLPWIMRTWTFPP